MSSDPEGSRIEAEAQSWVVRQDRGLLPDEFPVFEAWLRADPRHAAALHRQTQGWRALDRVGKAPGMASLADAIKAGALIRRNQRLRRRRAAVGWFAAAAAVVIGVFSYVSLRPPVLAPVEVRQAAYEVLPSDSRQLVLADGSIVDVRSGGEVAVEFTAGERRVRLVRGEAYFAVMKDAARPFVVAADGMAVRAVGTEFSVQLGADSVSVLVAEGAVLLDGAQSAPTVAAGSLATAGRTAGSAAIAREVARQELDELLRWRDVRIAFRDTSLGDAVSAFNRYNTRKLRVDDPAVRSRTIRGTVQAHNVDGFLDLLGRTMNVQAAPGPEGITELRSAPR